MGYKALISFDFWKYVEEPGNASWWVHNEKKNVTSYNTEHIVPALIDFSWPWLKRHQKHIEKSMVYVYEKCYTDRKLVWFKYFPWSSISKSNPTVKSLFSDFFSNKILKKRLNQTSFLCRTSISIVFWGKMFLHRLKYLLEKLKQGCQWTLKTLKSLESEKATLKTLKIVLGNLEILFFVCQKKIFLSSHVLYHVMLLCHYVWLVWIINQVYIVL